MPLVWIGTAISFLFLYPATYNLLEIPALLSPQVRLYSTGIIRISRHPQAIGQILWCATHLLWIGSSFMLVTCLGLIAHHLFGVWNGDRRLRLRFGEGFEELRACTSVIPFQAVLDGRQSLVLAEFLRPAQLGIGTHHCGVLVGPSLHRAGRHKLLPHRPGPLAGLMGGPPTVLLNRGRAA